MNCHKIMEKHLYHAYPLKLKTQRKSMTSCHQCTKDDKNGLCFVPGWTARIKSLYVIFCFALMLPLSGISQTVSFNARSLDFVYNTVQYPPTLADMDGDGRDELVRFSEDGIYVDYFPVSGGRLTIHIPVTIQHPPKWSVCAGDVDQNGLIDFVLGGDKKVTLLQQTGNGYQEKVMEGTLVCQRSNLLDLDRDGDLDLFVCNDEGENFYYENDGNGIFMRSTALSDLSLLAGNYSSIWTDLNGDRLPDLYLSKCFANVPSTDHRRKNLLYINKGNGRFEEFGEQSGIADTAQTWTTAAEDFDNDGDIDLYVLNHDMASRLFRNNGDGSFTDVIASSGFNAFDFNAYEVVTGDFNNDGFCDVMTDQEPSLYLGRGDLSFVASPTPAKAGAIGDINKDGFLDVFYKRTLYENTNNGNHWAKFRLHGIQSNAMGIGAIIRIYTNGISQTRELRAGQGYAAMSGLHIHFGLGKYTGIDSVKIEWPSGITTFISNLSSDATYEITECEGQAVTTQPEVRDILLCHSTITISTPTISGNWLWSNGVAGNTTTIDKPGNYTAYHQDSNGCWNAMMRYRILLENNNPPVFLRDSILTTPCFGSEVRLPYYLENNIISSQDWDGKKYLYPEQEGFYSIEKSLICSSDQVLADSIYISFINPDRPTVDSTHWTQDSVTFFSSNPNTIWYQDDQTNQPLAQGATYTGSIAFLFNKVFLEAYKWIAYPVQSGGRKNANGASAAFPNRSLYFSINTELILHSVDMYVLKKEDEGSRRIVITKSDGELFAEFTPDLKEGKNKVNMEVTLPKGQYQMSCDRSDQAMNAGDFNYPYPLADIGSIDSCSGNVNFYPYFYNWQFSNPPQLCASERNVFIWLSTQDDSDPNGIKIYPNPTSGKIKLDSGKHKITSYSILHSNGTLVKQGDCCANNDISAEDYPAGLYILILKTADGKSWVSKIIVTK